MRAAHPSITALSYQDDTNIVTDIHTAAAVLSTVEHEFSRVGLSVNKSKCAVYTRADVPPELECVFSDMTIARDGLMVLGSPLGSNAFMREKVELRLEEYCRGLELLPRLEHPQGLSSCCVTASTAGRSSSPARCRLGCAATCS